MIIGIDPCLKCGWAVRQSDGDMMGGTWNLAPTNKRIWEGVGMRYVRLAALLRNLFEMVSPDGVQLIAYEAVRRHLGTTAAHSYGAIVGVIQGQCERASFPYAGVPVLQLKQFATGTGKGKKEKMVITAKEKWPNVEIVDDNQADAMWLAEYGAIELLGKVEP